MLSCCAAVKSRSAVNLISEPSQYQGAFCSGHDRCSLESSDCPRHALATAPRRGIQLLQNGDTHRFRHVMAARLQML
jgi:hypothetical protein